MNVRRSRMAVMRGSIALVALAALFTTTACTPGGGESPDSDELFTPVTGTVEEQEAALLELAKQEPPILMYTSLDGTVMDQIAAAFKEEYGLSINHLRLGGADIRERFSSEATVGVHAADIIMSGEASTTVWNDDFLPDGWILPMSTELVPRLGEIDDLWIRPSYVAMSVNFLNTIVVNTNEVPESAAPTTFAELTGPEWTDEIYVQDPALSSFILGTFGVVHDTLGADWTEAMGTQGMQLAQVAPSMAGVAAGERKACLFCTNNHLAAFLGDAPDAPVAIYRLDDVPFGFALPTTIAADSPAQNSARLYVSWLISEAGQTAVVNATNGMSIRPDVVSPTGETPPADLLLVQDFFASSEANRAGILAPLGLE